MVSVTYTIPDEKFDEFKEAFIRAKPVPLDDDRNPIMSENEWIKEWGRRAMFAIFSRGREELHRDTMQAIDENIVSK